MVIGAPYSVPEFFPLDQADEEVSETGNLDQASIISDANGASDNIDRFQLEQSAPLDEYS